MVNKRLLKTCGWIILLCTIVFGIIEPGTFNLKYVAIAFLISSMYTLVNALGQGFLNDFLDKKWDWISDTNKRLWYGVSFTVITVVVSVLFCNYILFVYIQQIDPSKFFTGWYGFLNWFYINLSLLISAILHARSFMLAWKSSARKQVVEQKIIAKSANAQFESLKNQLDPHFLFNSLNVLDALIEENPQQAQRFTNDMSKIYRYVLDQKDKELVTIAEEIDFAKTYCELLKTRFEDSVSFEFQIEDAQLSNFVVPLSLQLLLENAIKHNYATEKKPLHIKIFTENGNLCVQNNTQVREIIKEREGIGLSNIVQRYSLVSKKNVHIEQSDDYFKVLIPILTEKISPTMENNINTNDALAYDRAVKRVKEIKGFYGNLISYCLVIPFLIFVNMRTSPEYHWFWWPMLGWGIGVASHGFQVFGIGKNWEDRKIKELMEKDRYKS